MPRVARIVIPGWPHHVVQRGNNRQDVFFVDDDCRAYLRFLCDQSARFGIHILGYCLMSNHVHIIAVPDGEDSLAKAIGRTHFLYAQYVNRVHGRSGHLWQNRFYSCASIRGAESCSCEDGPRGLATYLVERRRPHWGKGPRGSARSGCLVEGMESGCVAGGA